MHADVFILNVITCLKAGYSHFFIIVAINKTVFSGCEGGNIHLIFICACNQNQSKINTNVQQMLPPWN